MHHHYMLWSLTRRDGTQKPSSRLSERDLCRIVHPNFGEFHFHALGWIKGNTREKNWSIVALTTLQLAEKLIP